MARQAATGVRAQDSPTGVRLALTAVMRSPVGRALVPLALVCATLLPAAITVAACSSSTPGSPNKVPGQCVLSGGTWYCGTGYGDFPDCETWEAGTCEKNASCFSCQQTAGVACTCWPGDAATCTPTGTGCSQ
jgi:hypothetical protein